VHTLQFNIPGISQSSLIMLGAWFKAGNSLWLQHRMISYWNISRLTHGWTDLQWWITPTLKRCGLFNVHTSLHI